MCLSTGNPGVIYAGVFIAACAIYPAFPGNITWLSNNLAGSTKRAVGMGLHIGLGNMAGAMASNFYRARDAPVSCITSKQVLSRSNALTSVH